MGKIDVTVNDQASQPLRSITIRFGEATAAADKSAQQMNKLTQAAVGVAGGVRNLMIGYLFMQFAQERLVESVASVGQSLLSLNETLIQSTFLAQDWGASNIDAAMSGQGFKDVQANVESLLPKYEQLIRIRDTALAGHGRLSAEYLGATAALQAFNISNPGFQEDRARLEQTQLMKDQVTSQKLQLAVSQLALIENQRIAQLSEQILEITTIVGAAQMGFEIGMGTMVPGAGTVGALAGAALGIGIAGVEHIQFMNFQSQFNNMVQDLKNVGKDGLTPSIDKLTASIDKLTEQLSGGTSQAPIQGGLTFEQRHGLKTFSKG